MKCQYCTIIGWFRPRFLITSSITWGVAARPASWRATVSTGRAKNRKNAPVATSQTTTMPARMRRTMKARSAISVVSRRDGQGVRAWHTGTAADDGPPLGAQSAALPAPAPARQDSFGARVHRVPDTVAEQVEGERGDEQRGRREHHVPPGHLVEVLRVGQDVAPAGGGWLDAQAQIGERRLEDD